MITAGGCESMRVAGQINRQHREFVDKIAFGIARAAAKGSMKEANAPLPPKEPGKPFCYVVKTDDGHAPAQGKHLFATFNQMSLLNTDRQLAAEREVMELYKAGRCELHPTQSTRPVREAAWKNLKE